jgi:hypothetical protein
MKVIFKQNDNRKSNLLIPFLFTTIVPTLLD